MRLSVLYGNHFATNRQVNAAWTIDLYRHIGGSVFVRRRFIPPKRPLRYHPWPRPRPYLLSHSPNGRI